MRAEDGQRAGRDLAQVLDEARAFGLQRVHHVTIMDNLVAHIDRLAIFFERPFDDVDRPDDAGAKPPRLGKKDLHPLTFSPKLPAGPPKPGYPKPVSPDEFPNAI